MPESIKKGLIKTMITALESGGVPKAVAQRVARTKKLCCKDTNLNGVITRHYCLADECTGEWREEIED